jgi:2-polyprenyl-3-methyl-5-hydroxy-6-metoxy-1,4-benzoquinol methylase
MGVQTLESRWLAYLQKNYQQGFVRRLVYRMDLHFRSLPLENRSVLEIGAGGGFLSAFCAARGASRVVALEPEAAGSTKGVQQEFEKLSSNVGLADIVDYRHDRFEQFAESYKGEPFDYILMNDVINHLNEGAVVSLHLPKAQAEREVYISIFKEMYRLLQPGGLLIASDVGRHNFWNSIGVVVPITRTTEWHKHQQPKVWKRLLAEAGFNAIDVRWYNLFSLRKFAFLLCRRLPAYFSSSAFIITAYKNQRLKNST